MSDSLNKMRRVVIETLSLPGDGRRGSWFRSSLTKIVCFWVLAVLWPHSAMADWDVAPAARLYLNCEGQGEPSVILDAGLGGSSLEWVYVVEQLRPYTRVCTFDRAGYGNSEMGRMPRTSSRIANELYLALLQADVTPPYLLVGHSFGGFNVQLFARRYSYLIAGTVLLDASHPEQVDRFLAPPLNILTAPSSNIGIVRFRDPPPPSELLPTDVKEVISRRLLRWKTRQTVASELLNFRQSALQLAQTPGQPDLPLLVITRGRMDSPHDEKRILMERLWLELQVELADMSRQSAHFIARRAGHNIHIEQPEAVAFGVGLLVERFRAQQRNSDARGLLVPIPDAWAAQPLDITWMRDNLDLYPEQEQHSHLSW